MLAAFLINLSQNLFNTFFDWLKAMVKLFLQQIINRWLAGAIALLLIVNLAVVGVVKQQIIANRQQIAFTSAVLGQIETLLEGVFLAQQSGQNYILTGSESFLVQYQEGVRQANIALPQLEKLLVNRYQQQLDRINPLIKAEFVNLERSIELYQLNPAAIDSAQATLTQDNADLQQQIQTQFDTIEQLEKEFLQQQTDRVTASLRQLTWAIAVFFSFSIGLLLLICWLLRQQTRKRDRAETDLRQSEAQFRSLSEHFPIGVLLLDAAGKCIYANPRYHDISGCISDNVFGTGWLATVHPEDRPCLEKLFSPEAKDGYCEIRFCLPEGNINYSCLYLAPVLNERQQIVSYIGALEDITERRQIRQMKDEFISLVSHELRTPLASIQGSLGLLVSGILDDRPDTAKQMLEIASLDTERLTRLVNNILDLNRLEAGQVEINPQWHQAADLIQQAIDTVRAIAEENEITLSTTKTEVRVWADSDWIVQTLVNLLANGIKFSPPQSTIEITTYTQGKEVLWQIRDRGRGIPAHKLEQIFSRFQQVRFSDGRQQRGTGLGLSICRRIVELHGGRIWAESKPGNGSTFSFTLPLPEEKTK